MGRLFKSMRQSQEQSKVFPRPEPEQDRFRVKFERPSEAVVFWALENLCGGAGGRFMLSMRKLAKFCSLSVNTTNRAVLSLTKKGAIQYRRGYNQSRLSIFEIPQNTGEKLSQGKTAVAKIGVPPPSDSDTNINNLYTGDVSDRRDVHKQNRDSDDSAEERLAYRVAEGLGDMKNLRLYKSYCRRYPAEMILKAYVRAKEPTPDKIKKSRGALFNFLVQLYARRENNSNDSGSASRTA